VRENAQDFERKPLKGVQIIEPSEKGEAGYCLRRIFQRFQLVKFIEKFKTRVKIVEIEKVIAFDKYLHELSSLIIFTPVKNYFLR